MLHLLIKSGARYLCQKQIHIHWEKCLESTRLPGRMKGRTGQLILC